jgi:hypothetical protein
MTCASSLKENGLLFLVAESIGSVLKYGLKLRAYATPTTVKREELVYSHTIKDESKMFYIGSGSVQRAITSVDAAPIGAHASMIVAVRTK